MFILKFFIPFILKGIVMLFAMASLVAQMVKNLLTIREIWVQSLGWEDRLENPGNRRAWPVTVHRVSKSWT